MVWSFVDVVCSVRCAFKSFFFFSEVQLATLARPLLCAHIYYHFIFIFCLVCYCIVVVVIAAVCWNQCPSFTKGYIFWMLTKWNNYMFLSLLFFLFYFYKNMWLVLVVCAKCAYTGAPITTPMFWLFWRTDEKRQNAVRKRENGWRRGRWSHTNQIKTEREYHIFSAFIYLFLFRIFIYLFKTCFCKVFTVLFTTRILVFVNWLFLPLEQFSCKW